MYDLIRIYKYFLIVLFFPPSPLDIQEFYEVTLLDNPRCIDRSKQSKSIQHVNTWEISSLPSTTVTSETLPSSLSPSVEVRLKKKKVFLKLFS